MNTMLVANESYNSLSDIIHVFPETVQRGDFEVHFDRILKESSIDENKEIKDNAIEIASKLYDELDLVMNFHSLIDFSVKEIFLPVVAELLEKFFTFSLFAERE